MCLVDSAVPTGLVVLDAREPSNKLLGYYQTVPTGTKNHRLFVPSGIAVFLTRRVK